MPPIETDDEEAPKGIAHQKIQISKPSIFRRWIE